MLALALLTLAGSATSADAQDRRTVTRSRQLSGEEKLDVEVRYGAGRFSVRPAPAGVLYRMHIRYDAERFEPVSEYEDGRLELGVEGTESGFHIGKDHEGDLELLLARDVPMDLDLEFGAVWADIDLGGLALTDLDLRTGASESRMDVSIPNPVRLRKATFEIGAADFTAHHLGNLNADRIEVSTGVGEIQLHLTGEWRRDSEVSVKMGLGSLELRVPRGLGLKLEKSTFLTSMDMEGMVRRDDAYYSPGWDQSDRRITVDVEAAFGSIEVVWVR